MRHFFKLILFTPRELLHPIKFISGIQHLETVSGIEIHPH